MSGTKIVNCKCEHVYQDSKYGKQRRVANKMKGGKDNSNIKWKCTVCNAVID